MPHVGIRTIVPTVEEVVVTPDADAVVRDSLAELVTQARIRNLFLAEMTDEEIDADDVA